MKSRHPRPGLVPAAFFAALMFCTPAWSGESPPPAKEIVMNDEYMKRLIIFALDQPKPQTIPGSVGKIFGLGDGTKDLPMFNLETERPGGIFFSLSLDQPAHKDIVILRRIADGHLEAYLTDRSGKLRAAGITDDHGAHLITASEDVMTIYHAALDQLAREASEDLPPTIGTIELPPPPAK